MLVRIAVARVLFVLALLLAPFLTPRMADAHSGHHLSRDCIFLMESVSWLWPWEHAFDAGSFVDSHHVLLDVIRDTASSGVKGDGAKRVYASHNHPWFAGDRTDGYHNVYAHGLNFVVNTSNAGCF